MNSRKYAGITIGPIIETMSYTSKPAGLWFASYFFSSVTRDLCKQIIQEGFPILTLPESLNTVDAIDNNKNSDEGIGSFHDRIYFRLEGIEDDAVAGTTIQKIIDSVIEIKSEEVFQAVKDRDKEKYDESFVEDFLRKYLQIHFVIMDISEGDSISRTLADLLDALENSKKTVNVDDNFLRIIAEDNSCIKRYKAFEHAKMLQMEKESEIRVKDIRGIIQGGKCPADSKISKYFAIVQADGDNMGKVIVATGNDDASLEAQERKIIDFSTKCMNYTKEASKRITEYGGVVIYAGGDDLLFLAPITGKKGNIWSLCDEIAGEFDKVFPVDASVSFGVSINYYKFPLREAFMDARTLLFSKAKTGEKNNLAICVHKASGQTMGYISCLESKKAEKDKRLAAAIYSLISKLTEQEESNEYLHSLLYHIESKRTLFQIAIGQPDKMRLLFQNIFDGPKQDFVQAVIEFTKILSESEGMYKELEQGEDRNSQLMMLTNVLRITKFMVEKGADE